MGFMKDLLDQLQGTVGYGEEGMGLLGDTGGWLRDEVVVPGAQGIARATPDFIEDPLMSVAGTAMSILDAPRGFMAGGIGAADYHLAKLRYELGLEDEADWQNIQEAYARGGGREVWEDEIVGEMPRWQRGLLDVAIDPLTYAGIGLTGKLARGVTNTGRIMATAGSTPTRQAIGRGVTGLGKVAEGASTVMAAPDRILDPVFAKIVGKPVGWGVSKVTNNPIARRAAPTVQKKVADLFDLTPHEKLRLKVNELGDAVDQMLVGKQNANQALGLRAQQAQGVGLFAPQDASPDALFATQQLRNRTTTNPVARAILDTPTDPDAKNIILRFIQKVGGEDSGMGIMAGGAGEPAEQLVRNVRTPLGIGQTWGSQADKDKASQYLAKMLVANAPPTGGWTRVMDGIDNLQRVRQEFMTKYGLTNESFADVYSAAKKVVEERDGIRLPDEMYAGMHPGGGGFNRLNPSKQGVRGVYDESEADEFVANTAAGIHTAYFTVDEEAERAFMQTDEFLKARDELVGVIEHEGVAREFTSDGLFTGKNSFKTLESDEQFGRSGLRIMPREQAYELFQREFGVLNQQTMDELYDVGAERFRQEMVRAVAPSREFGGKGNPLAKTFDAPGNQTDPRVAASATKKGDYSYTKNRRLLMNRESADRLIKKGAAGAGFYGDGIPELRAKFESDEDFDWLIDLWVVTSSHTKLDANVTKALNAYIETGADGPAALRSLGLDPDAIDDYVRLYKDELSQMMLQEGEPTHRAAITAMMNGEDIGTQKLYSYKGSFQTEVALARSRMAYSGDLADNANWNIPVAERETLQREAEESIKRSAGVVTDDMWHQVANGLPTGPSGRQFEILEAASRQIARETGLMPHEVQAAVWAGIKGDFGNLLSDTGSDVSPAWLVTYKLFGGGEDVTKPIHRYGVDTFPQHPTGEGVQNYPARKGKKTVTAQRETYVDMNDVKVRGAINNFRYTFSRVSDAVTDLYGQAARKQMPIVLDFDNAKDGWLRGVDPDGGVYTARIDPAKSKGRQVRNAAVRKVGASDKLSTAELLDSGGTVVEIAIPPGSTDEVALAMFKTKLNADPLMNMDWSGYRFVLDPTEEGAGASLKLMWFPKGFRGSPSAGADALKWDILNGMPARKARFYAEKGIAPGEVPPALEFEYAREFMADMIKSDEVTKRWFATQNPLRNRVRDQLREILPKWQESPIFTADLTPEGLVSVENPKRYAVALTSAGEGGVLDFMDPSAPDFAAEFIEQMMPAAVGSNADRLRFGFFMDEDTGISSMDLTFFTDDERLAMELGRLTNQVSIYDTAAGNSIKTGGNSNSPYTTIEDIQDLLRKIEDAEELGEPLAYTMYPELGEDYLAATQGGLVTRDLPLREQLSTARQKGESRMAYLKRMLRNAHTGGQQVATDISKTFDYHRMPRTEAELTAEEAAQAARQLNMTELSASGTGGYRWLDQETNDLLYNTTFDDGTAVGRWAEQTYDDLQAERALLEKLGISWDAKAKPPMKLEAKLALTSRKDAQDVIRKWHKLDLNMDNTVDPMVTTKRLLADRLVAESGIVPKNATFYSKAKSLWSELALASGRYITANLSTNILDATITGHFNYGSPMDIFRYAAQDLKGEPIERFLDGTKAIENLTEKYGIGSNWTVTQNTAKKMTETTAQRSQARNVLKKLGIEKAAYAVETPRSLALGIDINSRLGIFTDQMDATFEAGRGELLGKIQAIADKAGVTLEPGDLLPYYDPAKAFRYYKSVGFSDGYAGRASREIAELRNVARKKAESEVKRISLAYQKTNLDDAISKVVPFHYWASRKVRFYAEEAYRNPVLAANYARAIRGIDRAQDDPGFNARQRGFLRLMSGPAGFTLLMNPDALMGVIKATGLQDSYTPDGQTEIGGIVQALKRNGVGLYPWIDGALNMMGMYGDTFEPDMLGIRHRALVGSVVNWMRGEGMFGDSNRDPGATPYADLSMEAREKVSSWASTFLPDWMSQPVAANAGGNPSSTSLDQVIESRIIDQNPNLTNAELVAIMNDPESDEYQEAFKAVSRAGVVQQLLSFTLPVSFRVEENSRDVRNAKQEMIRNQAEKKDVEPWEVSDTHADAQFRADYKRMTGEEFNANDWADAALEEDLMRATRDARPFVLMENEYQSIGGREGREIMNQYYAILNGEKTPPGYRGDVRNLTPEHRQWLADRWLDVSGSRQSFDTIRAAQRAYREQHPEFAQFKDWQGQMYDLQALYGGSLAEYRRQVVRQNPSAAQFFADQIRWLESRGVKPEDMEKELDRITASSNAWFAINGRPKTIYDPSLSAGVGDVSQQMLQPYANTYYTPPGPAAPSAAPGQPQLIGPGTNMYNVSQQPMQASQSGGDWTTALMNYRSSR